MSLVFGADTVTPATSLTDGFTVRRSGANFIGTDIIKKSGANTIVQDEGHAAGSGVAVVLIGGATGNLQITTATDPNDGSTCFSLNQGSSAAPRLAVIGANGAIKPFLRIGRGGGTPVQTDLEVHGTLTLSIPTGNNAIAFVGADANFTFANNAGIFGGAADKVGFYAHAGVAQQTLSTGAGHTVDDVITALQALGLVKQ